MFRIAFVLLVIISVALAQNSTTIASKSNNLNVPSNFAGRHVACRRNIDGTSSTAVLDIRGPNAKGEWRATSQTRLIAGDCNGGRVLYLENIGYQIIFLDSGVQDSQGVTKTYRLDVTRYWVTGFDDVHQLAVGTICSSGCCQTPNITKPVDIIKCNQCVPFSTYYQVYGLTRFFPDGSFYTSATPTCSVSTVQSVDTTLLYKVVLPPYGGVGSASSVVPSVVVATLLAFIALLLF